MGWFLVFGLIVGVPLGGAVGSRVSWFVGYVWGFAYFAYLGFVASVVSGPWTDSQWNLLGIFPLGIALSAFWSSAGASR